MVRVSTMVSELSDAGSVLCPSALQVNDFVRDKFTTKDGIPAFAEVLAGACVSMRQDQLSLCSKPPLNPGV